MFVQMFPPFTHFSPCPTSGQCMHITSALIPYLDLVWWLSPIVTLPPMGPMVSFLPACYIVHPLQLLSYGNVGREGEWERGEGGGEGERERERPIVLLKKEFLLYLPLTFPFSFVWTLRFCFVWTMSDYRPGPSSCSGEAVVPGARKPSVGEGTESRRLSPLQLLHCHHSSQQLTPHGARRLLNQSYTRLESQGRRWILQSGTRKQVHTQGTVQDFFYW